MENNEPHKAFIGSETDAMLWPSVSLLILNWNGKPLLERYLPSFLELDYPNYQIVVVDNGSKDDSVVYVQEHYPEFTLVEHKENLGFGAGLNPVIQQTDSDVVVLLNNDLEVRPDWLRALVSPILDDASIGVVGCKLLYPDEKTIQHAGASLTYPLALSQHEHYQEIDNGQADTAHDVDYVTGAAMAITRPVMDAIGLLDEEFSPYYYEEVDYCYRARSAGFRVVYEPAASAIHHESYVMNQVGKQKLFALEKNRLRFVLRYYSAEQFFDDYVPAELERIKSPLSADSLYQLRRALVATKLQLVTILQERNEVDQLAKYEAAIGLLRETAVSQHAKIYTAAPEGFVETALTERQTLAEPNFTSKTPVVGPIIAFFRRTWNSVSTKWYVRAIIQQQMEFNRLVTRLLSEQDRQTEELTQEIDLLTKELLTLRQKLNQLEVFLPGEDEERLA